MTVLSDLAAAFAERELTAPVLLVGTGATTRAFFDRRGQVRQLPGLAMMAVAETDTLTIQHGALVGAAQNMAVIVGPVGADVADEAQGGVRYTIARPPQRVEDGLVDELALAGGKDS